jgi:UDP-N-acetylglucosamine:LPS N-acetylglucosamine transferase
MIVRPDFYRARTVDRRAELERLNLDPDRPTALVLFGGHGSRAMRGIARRLQDTQLILICGHNAPLAERLGSVRARAPRLVLGFTPNISDFMHLSDFLIGKPGPGCISEAIQQGLPVIVVKNRWTMPQERYNADWVVENQAGIVLDSFTRIGEGVQSMIARLPELRSSVARIHNRAVFEIPEILGRILQEERKDHVLPARSIRRRRSASALMRYFEAPTR